MQTLIEQFEAFAKQHDPYEPYNYKDGYVCANSRFAASLGIAYSGISTPGLADTETIAAERPWTWGGVVRRCQKARKDPRYIEHLRYGRPSYSSCSCQDCMYVHGLHSQRYAEPPITYQRIPMDYVDMDYVE